MSLRRVKDTFMKHTIFGVAAFNIIIVFAIFFFVFTNGMKFFHKGNVGEFFIGNTWIPLSELYGLIPLLKGSFWVSFIALSISIPFSLFIAIYISEYAGKRTREVFKVLIETMAALPSVVLGYIGLYVFSNIIKDIFNLDSGLTALNGGILLALMAIPTMVSISDDAIMALDRSYKEASLAMGANKLETIVKILLPAAFPGIFAGIMLGFGRVIGETMTVLMVTGNAPILDSGPLTAVRTLTATIAAEMGEVTVGDKHYYSLFAIGIVLFTISFITNTVADYFIHKSRKSKG